MTLDGAQTGGTATAGSFPTTAGGTYQWLASYCGDANDAAAPPCAPTRRADGRAADTAAATTAAATAAATATTAPATATTTTTTAGRGCGAARDVGAERDGEGDPPTGCVTTNFNVQVTGGQIRRVEFYLNGRKIRSLTRPNRGTRFALPVRPNTLRAAERTALAVTYFTQASGTRRCASCVSCSRVARADSSRAAVHGLIGRFSRHAPGVRHRRTPVGVRTAWLRRVRRGDRRRARN